MNMKQSTKKNKALFSVLQITLLLAMVTVAGYLIFQNYVPKFFAAAATFVIVYFTFKKNRWGYFATAAWGLACYQMAKEGFAFDDIRRWVMIGSIAVIIVAFVLHEAYCRIPKPSDK